MTFGTTTANYNPPSDPGGASGRRWGDYSFTVVDPLDDMTVWTIQEYNQALNSYAVRVGKLAAPPPATPTCSASPITFTGPHRQRGDHRHLERRLGLLRSRRQPGAAGAAVQPSPATVTNAIVNSVTYNSPTQVTLNITALDRLAERHHHQSRRPERDGQRLHQRDSGGHRDAHGHAERQRWQRHDRTVDTAERQ